MPPTQAGTRYRGGNTKKEIPCRYEVLYVLVWLSHRCPVHACTRRLHNQLVFVAGHAPRKNDREVAAMDCEQANSSVCASPTILDFPVEHQLADIKEPYTVGDDRIAASMISSLRSPLYAQHYTITRKQSWPTRKLSLPLADPLPSMTSAWSVGFRRQGGRTNSACCCLGV